MTPSVHISLNVRDLSRSVDFYRRFFGEPAKLKSDYAKFVTKGPDIHLALGPGRAESSGAGALSHLGIRVGSVDEVERWKNTLRGRGLQVNDPERSECCYALQDKFWITDPDGNEWEIYTVLRDVETMGVDAGACCVEKGVAPSDETSCCAG
jgi:catechol 2,3-dioxygenase-like lactoylglutathione lyase family enzyme